jgi:ABC-type transport system involved in multi-copper enzyme maturation permease subunit
MSYAIGMAFMGWGDHAVFAGTSYSTSEGILLAIKAYGSSILPLMAFGMISAFISVVSSAAPVAIAVSASLSLVGQYLSAIPAARIFSVIHQTYFFSDYFTKSMNVKEAILSAGASLAYILVFYALAAFAFLRKDMP